MVTGKGGRRRRAKGGGIGRGTEAERLAAIKKRNRVDEGRIDCIASSERKKKEREGGEEREDLPVEYCITFHRSAGSVIRSFLLQTFTLLSLLPWPGKALIASH